jgi:pyruvate,orthophosphate dikinase
MVAEGLITKDEAINRVTGAQLDQLLHPRIDPNALEGATFLAAGLAASPGSAVGKVVLNADVAAELGHNGGKGENVILVRDETNPDDVHGMLAAKAVLTARGGKTSHAAVVARGFGIPCVAGAEAIRVDEHNGQFKVGDLVVKEGDIITLDGSTGKIYLGALKLVDPEVSGWFGELMEWADARRTLKVRTNADNPRDARQAIALGAEGIGLCRTEHMFFEQERLPIVQEMILAKEESVQNAALDQLLPFQQKDFEGIFEAMDGKPVTIRLIDPPLHEFLPSKDAMREEIAEAERQGLSKTSPEYAAKVRMLEAVEQMHEANPMLGFRGCRLSIVIPGIVAMQTRAIMQAAAVVKKAGITVLPEIMIPLVGHVNELKVVQTQLEAVAKQVCEEQGVDIPYMFGTMIEVPRATVIADQLAEYAQFFSFGTNDLTQMTFGYSRDDAGRFLTPYIEKKILAVDPFETLDTEGVGQLMKMCVAKAKPVRPNIKLGICGEHGGDPDSVKFCHSIGLDYVSCSPFRVPIARLAAAQAAIGDGKERDR